MKPHKIRKTLLCTAFLLGIGNFSLRADENGLFSKPAQSAETASSATDITQINIIKRQKITEERYNGSTYNRKISYFEKGGRLLQTINIGSSATGKDVVDFYEYDCIGRADSVTYMPYTLASTGGVQRAAPKEEQKTFYKSLFPSPDDYNYAVYGIQYAVSPFSQVVKEGGAGKKYSINGGTGSHITSYTYGKNTATEVYKYVIGVAGTVSATQKYQAGSLSKIHSAFDVSANNRVMTTEYKDASGKLIAKSVSGSNEATRFTYYVYDDMDRLRYIVPDVAHQKIKDVKAFHSPDAYRKYWYYYEYDTEGRVIRTIKPGKADEYFVYDNKGRLVMSQDGNMREENRWLYRYYDTLGRETGSMLITDTGSTPLSSEEIQTLFRNDTFPGVTGSSRFKEYYMLQSNGYDRYEGFTAEPFAPVAGVATADMLARSNLGRLLNELVFVLPYDGTNKIVGYVSRTYYYDKKGRMLQTVEYDSFTVSTSRYTNKYDLAGNVVTTVETHSDHTATNTKRTDFTYDKFGRLLAEKTTVNTSAPVTVTYTYDELGNMASKTLGNSGVTETYAYNLQGMLLSQDSKRMRMDYTYDTQVSGYANKPRYDGNLSMVKWQYKTTAPKDEAYVYDYDKWGQLAQGKYFSAGTAAGIYDESVEYDANGNIIRMQRKGGSAGQDTDYSYVYDGNHLSSIEYTERSKTGTYTFSHDTNGNMADNPRRGWEYRYNHLNLLSHIVDSYGLMCYYMWLADGTKYGVEDISGHRTRIYKGSFTYNGMEEADAESVSFSDGEFLATGSDSAGNILFSPNYVLADRLGSPRVVMDSKGSTITRNSYYPFGLTHYNYLYTEQLLKTNRYHFNGKEKQTFSTLIDYHLLDYGSRMYDPYLCRWTTQDPADQLLNPYVFSGNNPVNFYDPDGEWFFSLIFPGVGTIVDAVLWGTTGAYLGGVAANNKQWNPIKWDWHSGKTWGGMLGGAAQGVLTGGGFWYAMQPLVGSSIYKGASLFGKILNWTQTVAFSASVLTSTTSMLTHSRTASDIILGQFYYDGTKSVAHQLWQAVSRRTWESMQQWLGYNIAQARNTFGGVDNVQFSRGAILANNNNPNTTRRWGVTLGNTINGMNMDVSLPIFTHEYGHTLQGRRWGPLYFLMIAPSSLISCAGERHIHIRRWYERQATKLGYDKYRREQSWPSEIYPF